MYCTAFQILYIAMFVIGHYLCEVGAAMYGSGTAAS